MSNEKILPDIKGSDTIAASWSRLLTRDRNVSTLFAGDSFTTDQTSEDVGRPNWRTDSKRLYIWNGEAFEPYLEIIDLKDIPFDIDNPDITEDEKNLGDVVSALVRRSNLNTVTLPAEGTNYTADGNETTFAIPRKTANKYSLFIFIEGVKQDASTYDLSSDGLSITFKNAPARGEEIEIIEQSSITEWDYSPNIQHLTGDGSTKVFTLDFEVLRPEVVSVNVDGVELQKNQFSVTGSNELTLVDAPANNAKIQVMVLGKTSFVTVSPNSIGTEELKSKSVTKEKLEDGIAFNINMIGTGDIKSNQLAEGSVTNTKLGDNSVTTGKVADKAITEEKLSTAVQGKLLNSGSVDTFEIKDDAVTESKLAKVVRDKLNNSGDLSNYYTKTQIDNKGFITSSILNGYATKTYVDAGLNRKQNTISDLATIRSGAELGSTALQPSALNGYATQAWVGQQGYITGITSGDVTTALGYTPYNSSNPNGYITSSALVPYALDTNVVHKTGSETITGAKAFTSSLDKKSTDDDYTLTPSEQSATFFGVVDKNANWLGGFEHYHRTDGAYIKQMVVRQQNSNNYTWLQIGITSDGTAFTEAPACDLNNSIVTTVNKSKARNGYFQLGNGLIIQWGEGTIAADATSANVTFPRAFTSSTSYTFTAQHRGNSNATTIITHEQPTTTNIKINYSQSYSGGIRAFGWIAIGY